ncbi:MAG: Hsp20/alpha crystallin family protein [Planctomycetales bacterium]
MLRIQSFSPVSQLRSDMDRIISDVFRSGDEPFLQLSGRRGNPALDIWEEGDEFFVAAELPGVAESDMSISTMGRELTLEGPWNISGEDAEKSNTEEDPSVADLAHHHRERRRGKYHRVIRFPFDIDIDHVEANLSAGVLTIRVPKAASALPRRIEVSGD